jgi:hypothetical protein
MPELSMPDFLTRRAGMSVWIIWWRNDHPISLIVGANDPAFLLAVHDVLGPCGISRRKSPDRPDNSAGGTDPKTKKE